MVDATGPQSDSEPGNGTGDGIGPWVRRVYVSKSRAGELSPADWHDSFIYLLA